MSKNILQPTSNIDITIININAIKINGKCVIYTGTGWVRQSGFYTDEEVKALKSITARLDKNRKK